MKARVIVLLLVLATSACNKRAAVQPAAAQGTAVGVALVEVGGSKQIARVGAILDQPIVVQVNDAQGSALQGASVIVSGPPGVKFDPVTGLTDSSGQFTTVVSASGTPGHFQIVADTGGGKAPELKMDEIALGYQQELGRDLNVRYCARCHDPESTPERVSNMDNLDPKPHAFTEGDVLNKIGDSDLVAIINHGGPALSKSASMPPFGFTLTKTEIEALISYIRAVSDPPYRAVGAAYANK